MRKDITEFIKHAEDVLNKITTYNDPEISKDNLEIIAKKIKGMINSLNQKSLTSVNYHYSDLTRFIVDYWPLGNKLGIEISNLEEEYKKVIGINELNHLLTKARSIVDDKLKKAPQWQTLQIIQKQLIAIEEDLKNQGVSKDELKKRINIGLIAAREFEADDPDFADILQKIDYRYKKL